jgi:hypothetical protein
LAKDSSIADPSGESLIEAEQLLPYTWRKQPDYDAVLFDIARALDRWRDCLATQCGKTMAATQVERNRIAAYLDFHEYDITSGVMDPLRALRRQLTLTAED